VQTNSSFDLYLEESALDLCCEDYLNFRIFFCLESLAMRKKFIFQTTGPFVSGLFSLWVMFTNLLILVWVYLFLIVPCHKQLKAILILSILCLFGDLLGQVSNLTRYTFYLPRYHKWQFSQMNQVYIIQVTIFLAFYKFYKHFYSFLKWFITIPPASIDHLYPKPII
jgi:hypothetical protein